MKKTKKILKWIAGSILFVVAALCTLYLYFFHVFTPAQPALTGKFHYSELQVKGNERSFGYYIPGRLENNPAVVFVLHGSRGSGDDIRKQTAFEFDSLADQAGFLVVYPDGYKNHWNDCRASAAFAANKEKIDDNAFFSSMFEFFARKHSVDPKRVFVMGFSNGGHMAFGLAYEMPEKIAAIAAIGANLPVESNLDCTRHGKPVSMAIINGTVDPMNPYNGGLVTVLGDSSRGVVVASSETAAYWLNLASIDGPGKTIVHDEADGDPQTSISEVRWESSQGVQVRLYTMHGSGHVVSSKKVRFGRFYGVNAGDLEAPVEIWNFFSEVAGKK